MSLISNRRQTLVLSRPQPYLFTPGERVTFYRLDERMRGLPNEPGTIVADEGRIKITVRDAQGEVHSILPGQAWNEASRAHASREGGKR